MANNVSETLIGAVVLTVAGSFLYYAMQTSGFSADTSQYSLSASFRSVAGLNVGSDVKLSGVKVGTLTSITLDPDTYQAITRVSIDNDVLIPDDAEIKVSTDGLLGSAYLEVTAGGSPFMLEPNGEFIYTQGAVNLLNLLLKFGGSDDK
ncbi:outer membrane lipid asymmetry maintenance protein MlaD [Rhodobacterales bacterium 52_120_T64]|nr:outer membrane lipid asymmetry maintenance protein MlaD [Rhodobacterales bacterium 52_120_T64]